MNEPKVKYKKVDSLVHGRDRGSGFVVVLRTYDKIIAIDNKTRVIDQEEKNKIFIMY